MVLVPEESQQKQGSGYHALLHNIKCLRERRPPHVLADVDPGLTIPVLNPTATFSDDINQNSIVLKMTYGGVSFLFMGDANADAESKIANSGTNLQADILKVGHHGNATSSSSTFLTKVNPKTSVIEVGAGNSYGHLTSATYDRLAQVGSAVYRTYLNGDVTVTTDGTTGRCQN